MTVWSVPTTASDVTSDTSPSANHASPSTPPNVTAGDLLFAFAWFRNAGGTITPPVDGTWTRFGAQDAANSTAAVYFKPIANSGAATTALTATNLFTTSASSGRAIVTIIRIVGGANLTTPLDVAGVISVFTGTSSVTIPGVTTGQANTLLVAVANGQTSTATPVGFTPPGGWNTAVTASAVTSSPSSSATWIGTKVQATAGASGNLVLPLSPAGSNSEGWMLSLAPGGGLLPTAAFTSSSVGTDGVFDASTSAPVAGDTITGYSWDFGDSTSGTGVNPTHHYASAGTYTVVLTVTDSNGQTNTASHPITVTAPPGTATVASVISSTGWTASTGDTVLSALSDTISGAPKLTSFAVGGSGQEIDVVLGPLSPPATGQPLTVTLYCDRMSSTSGTLAAQLFEGGTSRSTLQSGLTVQDMTASGGSGNSLSGAVSNTATLAITFPWSQVSAVTDWNQLILHLIPTLA